MHIVGDIAVVEVKLCPTAEANRDQTLSARGSVAPEIPCWRLAQIVRSLRIKPRRFVFDFGPRGDNEEHTRAKRNVPVTSPTNNSCDAGHLHSHTSLWFSEELKSQTFRLRSSLLIRSLNGSLDNRIKVVVEHHLEQSQAMDNLRRSLGERYEKACKPLRTWDARCGELSPLQARLHERVASAAPHQVVEGASRPKERKVGKPAK
jgi:hypothetical protein